jgi:hypothetical protein
MNNLTIAVIVIAVAQALTILLAIALEREIKRLRELVTEHRRIQIAEIKARLGKRIQSAQPRRIKPDRGPIREPIADDMRVPEPAITIVPAPAITPKDLPDTIRPSTAEDELKRATKAINWLKEDVDKARANVAAQQANRTGPVMPLEIHTAQEVDAEVDSRF